MINKDIKNKNVLVTGGTGSVGTAFINSILKNDKPKKVIVYSRDELKQYDMERKLKNNKVKFIIGDIRDLQRLLVSCKGVDTIIHSAALKHVPIAEKNPIEYVKTNILGADNIIKASITNKVKKVVALSTDKASSPINLYGTTKLASDKLFVSANFEYPESKSIFSVVRYGNVINSRGSILPLLKELKENNSKIIPITNKNMTRFWISLNDGVNFVKNCLNTMKGGEIFIPKLKSIKTTDLAKVILPKSQIKIIGIRSGEKIHEVLCPKDTNHLTLEYKNYYAIFQDEQSLKSKKTNSLGEIGKKVQISFDYQSGNKKLLLSSKQIKFFLKKYIN